MLVLLEQPLNTYPQSRMGCLVPLLEAQREPQLLPQIDVKLLKIANFRHFGFYDVTRLPVIVRR